MNPLTQSKNTTILPVLSALACFALSPQARAVCQDGCDLINSNTFLGDNALINNTTGDNNTATGANALASNAEGEFNTANGASALSSNVNGVNNTATGANALTSNTFGGDNTATGAQTLTRSTTGSANTATGSAALEFNTTGSDNTADGTSALVNNTTGNFNTATGQGSLNLNTTGFQNTANGAGALFDNTTGSNNTAVGNNALLFNTTGNSNIAIGESAGKNLTNGRNNIDIGNVGTTGESAKIRIGNNAHKNTFIAGISGVTVAGGVGVVIDTDGHLGTITSSARFKEAIRPMDKASETILALKPVTFHYKKDIDPDGIPQFGLVAEQVEKVNPDLVARDKESKPYTVRYEAVNAMLLNEFLKAHRRIEQLEATVVQQQKGMEILTARLEEQESQIQKVSAQLEARKPSPQIVLNNQ
jgi:hypothetical protein